jgi:hypothetical protein
MNRAFVAVCLVTSVLLCSHAFAQDEGTEKAASPDREQLIKQLEKTLTGAKFEGRFTVDGKEQATKPGGDEEYTITSARKLPEGDLWLLKARIKYGDKDAVVPIPLEIKWAGDTPVITMTRMAIPEMGTFSARVVIYEGRYAGTWQHDAVGGHLYGIVRKATEEETQAAEKKSK